MKAEILIWNGTNLEDFLRTCVWSEHSVVDNVLYLRLRENNFTLKIGDMISRSGIDGRIELAIFYGHTKEILRNQFKREQEKI